MSMSNRFMASIAFAVTLVAGDLLGAMAAKATTYNYTFIATDTSQTATGTFDTVLDGANLRIFGITSTLSGIVNDATSAYSIVPNPNFPGTSNSGVFPPTTDYPGGFYFTYDNRFSVSHPYLTNPGVFFQNLTNLVYWNLFTVDGFSNPLTDYVLYNSTGQHWNGALYVSQTPLPAGLALFASGLGGLGWLGWRKKRKAGATATA